MTLQRRRFLKLLGLGVASIPSSKAFGSDIQESETKRIKQEKKVFQATEAAKIKGTPEQQAFWDERKRIADELIKNCTVHGNTHIACSGTFLPV
jgi:phage-related protein